MSALMMRMRPLARYTNRIGSTHRPFGRPPEQSVALAAAEERLATRSEIARLLATHPALRSSLASANTMASLQHLS